MIKKYCFKVDYGRLFTLFKEDEEFELKIENTENNSCFLNKEELKLILLLHQTFHLNIDKLIKSKYGRKEEIMTITNNIHDIEFIFNDGMGCEENIEIKIYGYYEGEYEKKIKAYISEKEIRRIMEEIGEKE